MTIESLEAFLKANGIDWPIVAHELPAAPERCIAIRGYSGIPGRYRDDDGRPTDDYPRFQVLTRDRDDLTAEAKAKELWALCHVRHSKALGAHAFHLEAEQRPAYMMGRETGLYVYVFNISAHVLI